ncbi:MAG: MurR/RpiR family transcriptional regulator [Phycisphaeraceae bacterium]|nr:MurR/RpiR family transcriptional regulator [Phycisphaerales bacterium]MCB9842844.1 MurR/RpiR family transcriptional regulator [Phycisphaeraceae bacterium]
MSLQELIAPVSDSLTPTERRISALLIQDATLLAFGTVSDIAERVGTSRPSIVRFATKLGFDGFTDLQNWMRQDLTRQLNSPTRRVRLREGQATPVRESINNALRHALDTLTDERLTTLATPIAKARAVWILSGETSMAGATVLTSGLSMVRDHINLVHEQTAARQLCGAQRDDAAVIFDFARYRRHSVVTARALAKQGVTIIAITDSPLSPLASLTKTWCQLIIPAVGPFDSALPAVLTAELITARVVRLLGKKAHARIDRLEELWQQLGTFLEYVPRQQKMNGSPIDQSRPPRTTPPK